MSSRTLNVNRPVAFPAGLALAPAEPGTPGAAERAPARAEAGILDDPLVRAFCSAVMVEVAAVGARIGCAIDQSPEDRHAVTRKLGAFKTSMLQDVEAGRSLELDGIVAAVREIAARVGVSTPNLDALFGLVRLMAQGRGLYPG